MRARGAQVTDVVILVVAADDGPMPQTVEAINHAKSAGVPIVVAINKADVPGANPERVKQALTEYGLVPEEWGGETLMVAVSAVARSGLDDLLEAVLLVADMRELSATPERRARATVVEGRLDRGRGPVATVLVMDGTLRVGDAFVVGATAGRVRAMFSDQGESVKEAGPATPVEVIGLGEVPEAGDRLIAVGDERKARELAEQRRDARRVKGGAGPEGLGFEELFERSQASELRTLLVVLKTDVHGSLEAISSSIETLSTEEVPVRIVHRGVGAITESDVMLATAAGAEVIGFNVRPEPKASKTAEANHVEIRVYRVIYELLDELRARLAGLRKPVLHEEVLGRAQVRQVFRVPRGGTVAGLMVTDGRLARSARVRVLRDSVVVHEGQVASLRRFKDDVREVQSGYECGLMVERFNDIQEGDVIEAYVIEEVPPEA
jgi:translation initiation factor IF-2